MITFSIATALLYSILRYETYITETFKYCINNNKPFKDNTMWVRIIIAGIIGLLYYVSFK